MFKIANSTTTWGSFYSVEGKKLGMNTNSSVSRTIEGGFQFLKLYLYLNTWEEKWVFVLELLHLRMDGWLSYLKSTQHMANLWVEKEDQETFRPHDTTPGDGEQISKMYPQYHLSDFALLWLALLHLEKLIKLIEYKFKGQREAPAESLVRMLERVQQSFAYYQDSLSLDKLRSNVMKTFQVSSSTFNTDFPIDGQDSLGSMPRASQASVIRSTGSPSTPTEQSTTSRKFDQDGHVNESNQQVIIFQRTINQYVLDIQPTEFATIEAAILGMFEQSGEEVEAAWRETLKLQKDKEISTFDDPRRIALSLFALRFDYDLANSSGGRNEHAMRRRLTAALYDSGMFARTIIGNTPEPMRGWSDANHETLSLMVGGLFQGCRDIM